MKKFRSFRNKKKHLSSKYILLILTGVCIVALFTSLVFNLSGGPLNSVAGYVFVPMQKGINNAGSWISGKARMLAGLFYRNRYVSAQSETFARLAVCA